MTDRVERELELPVAPESVWDAVTSDGWLADEVDLELRPGGDAQFRSGQEVREGWVEEALAPSRLAFWWASDGEPASRVELTIERRDRGTSLRVVETRPLDVLDLVGVPLPGIDGARRSFGPALVAA
jgi:uncharacterized protein YndB with AHSA1/START domain